MKSDISLFRLDVESTSEFSFVGRNRRRHGLTIYIYSNRDISNSEDTGPLLEIRFPEEGGRGICGSAVSRGTTYCMLSLYECNSDSHTRSRGLRYELPVGKGGAWVVPEPSALQLLKYAFYQPSLIGATDSKVNNFEGLPMSY